MNLASMNLASRNGRVSRLAACGGVLLLWGGTVMANIGVELQMEHSSLMLHEPVIAFVLIRNESSEVLTVDEGGGGATAQLDFHVERGVNEPVARTIRTALVGRNRLRPGERRSFMIDVSRNYDMGHRGGFSMRAEVTWRGIRYASGLKHIDVVYGLPLMETRVTNAGTGELRTYQLRYMNRGGQERLFITVDDETSRKNFGVFDLGPLVRVYHPRMEVKPTGWITVIHQSGSAMYTRSVLDSNDNAVWFIDQESRRDAEALQGSVSEQVSRSVEKPPPKAPKRTRSILGIFRGGK